MPNYKIDSFKGLRFGEVGLAKGELNKLTNFRVDNNLKLVKRGGYSLLHDTETSAPIDGQWFGRLSGSWAHLLACNKKISCRTEDGTVTEVGSYVGRKVNFTQFGNEVFIQDGVEFYKFDGNMGGVSGLSNVLFDSRGAVVTYPYTVSLPSGAYEFTLCGGKGADKQARVGKAVGVGGSGGRIRFSLTLESAGSVVIKHIFASTPTIGDAYAVYVGADLVAVVGGGGDAGAGNKSNDYYYGFPGGPGGPLTLGPQYTSPPATGLYPAYRNATGGTMEEGGLGGSVNYSTYSDSEPGNAFDHATDPGKGGLVDSALSSIFPGLIGNGGSGYCGGGAGGLYTGGNYRLGGASGGGSSFVAEDAVAEVFENVGGVHQSAGYIQIVQTLTFGTIKTVEGYIPKVYISGLPDGTNATEYEPVNMLTMKRRQSFNGDGVSTEFHLVEATNVSIDKATVNGSEFTGYTANAGKGIVTISPAPSEGVDNVEIWYTHSATNSARSEITSKTHARLFGGKNDNRMFLYGGGNRIVFSDLASGIPTPEYFPVYNTIDVGSAQYGVTGLRPHYDRMLIFKEDATWWTQYTFDSVLYTASFPIYPLNDNVGAEYIGTDQLIRNNPYVLSGKQVFEFVTSSVRDERSSKYKSEAVQGFLETLDFTNVLTFDHFRENEYWIVADRDAYIYNYVLDLWYRFTFGHPIRSICDAKAGLVLGDDIGRLFVMDDSGMDYDRLIESEAETGWLDLGAPEFYKYIDYTYPQIVSGEGVSLGMSIMADGDREREIFFDQFEAPRIPRPLKVRTKAKKFSYIKFRFTNNEAGELRLIGLSVPYNVAGTYRG
ncbi:MAG: hypothetical protein M0P69_12295 [Bacteroidales bacterium]|nr:hypothetical protein [Bacteroidales bacterium]